MERASRSFGDLLHYHRLAAGLTQHDLARCAEVSVRALRDIEQHRVRRPHARSVDRLASALGLTGAARDRLVAAAAAAGAGQSQRPGDPDQHRLRIGVLGPLAVRRGDAAVDPAAAKPRCLLGLLAIQPNRIVTIEEIVDVLWGDRPPASCRSLVQDYVGRLRRLVEPGRQPRAPARTLRSVPAGYLLRLDDDELDLLRFDRLAARARVLRETDDPLAARTVFGESLSCWRGAVLADLRGTPLQQHPAAVGLAQRRITAALGYADLAIAAGEYEPAVDQLDGLARDEPLQEGLHARLMLALAGSGRQAAALTVFTDLRARLADDLGVEPGAELSAAYVRVLRHDLPGGDPAAVEATAAVGAVPSAMPAQLPADLAMFTGRAEHLRELDALLPRGRGQAVAIAAIAGTAGVGKTALAVHWGHRVRDRFPDGQLYANLRGYASAPPVRPIEVLVWFLRALGVPPERIPVDVVEAAGLYRSLLAGRRMLIVLDNARDAEQVRPLLPGGAGCLVLVTSRDLLAGLLAREGASSVALDVLTEEEGVALLARVLGSARVTAERAAAGELSGVCAHLPLALGIAAANLTTHPAASIAGYLAELRAGNRLAELAVDGDRQTAVRATFDLSYATLHASAAQMFRLLGLVPGPDFTAELAARLAACSVQRAARLLDRLATVHLIGQRTPGRYAFHDLLRQYAGERVAAEDGEPERRDAVQRMYDYLLYTVDSAAQRLHPEKLRLPLHPPDPGAPPVTAFDDHIQALAWLDAERANLLAATEHAARVGPRAVAWQLADALRGYLWLRRYAVDWLAVAQIGLAAAEADGELRAQASAELSLADVHRSQGQYPEAIAHYQAALRLNRQVDWPEARSAVLGNLGNAYSDIGRPRDGADHYAQALAIDRQTGRVAALAVNVGNLGFVYQELGRLSEAADLHRQALRLDRQSGCRAGEAIDLANLGGTCHALGQAAEAVEYLTRALELHREVGDRGGEAEALHALAAVHADADRSPLALQLASDAVALARDTGERRVEAEALHRLSTVHYRLGQHDQAIAHARHALLVARAAGIRYPEAVALVGLATVHLARRDLLLAEEYAREARTLARAAGYRLVEANALDVLGGVHAEAGRPAAAVSSWEQALRAFDRIGSPHGDEVRRRLADGALHPS